MQSVEKSLSTLAWAAYGLTLQGEEFCFVNVYAPNDQNQQINFYNEFTNWTRGTYLEV